MHWISYSWFTIKASVVQQYKTPSTETALRAEHTILKWFFLCSHLHYHACIEPISSAQDTALVEEGDHYRLAPDYPSTKQTDNVKGQYAAIFCCEVENFKLVCCDCSSIHVFCFECSLHGSHHLHHHRKLFSKSFTDTKMTWCLTLRQCLQ